MNQRVLFASLLLPLLQTAIVAAADPVSFNRDVRPLLAGKCFACHGPDDEARQADLRLDDRASAMEADVLAPGNADESELMARITSDDPDLRMPPPEADGPLNEEEVEVFRNWISSGAEYTQHWAFTHPVRPDVPKVSDEDWPANPIDAFVMRRLDQESLRPSGQADRWTLVRRVYLDLIGIPPTIEQADEFVNSKDPNAYQALVDELLKSPRYGERWARPWLDLARYSDTNGYEKDRPRSIWPYRDWVIRALNDDMPFNEFTVQQIAGDMLPDANAAQRIATGFHRNTMLNEEGGIDPLEYRFYAMVDRVATTGTVWMGLSTGCAQCHSHKYDPISHSDYYRMMGLLNNADEPDMIVRDPQEAEKVAALRQKMQRMTRRLADQFPVTETPKEDAVTADQREAALEAARSEWIDDQRSKLVQWRVLRPTSMTSNLPRLERLEDDSIFVTGDATKRDVYSLSFDVPQDFTVSAVRLEVLPDDRLPARGPGLAYYEGRKGDFFLSELSATLADRPLKWARGSISFGKLSIGGGKVVPENVYDGNGSTGWSTSGQEGRRNELVLNLEQPLSGGGRLDLEMLFERHFVAGLGRFRISIASADRDATASKMPDEVANILVMESASWTSAENRLVTDYFLETTPLLAEQRKPIDAIRRQLESAPVTMVMRERPSDNQRPTFRHHRGEYLSPREQVEPGLPALFGDSEDITDRLSFARWLASNQNPLVGRVTVNRAWRALFGAGLMRTSGDFGTQSDPPTHPKLLDWLAKEFTEGGEFVQTPWSMKQLHRLIVNSRTYQQDSAISEELLQRDRENRWLARGARYRLDAEMVRDLMLAASSLLSEKMYGPSVFPPQPASVTALAYGSTKWNVSKGEDRYRRSLYTYSKRTAPFASYTVFDGPTGENCMPRRNRSNTPLAALTLMNDPMFVEMATALAEAAFSESGDDRAKVAINMFRRLLTRHPTDAELDFILGFQSKQQQRIEAGEIDAVALLGQEKSKKTPASLASWVFLARALMNLDEAITNH